MSWLAILNKGDFWIADRIEGKIKYLKKLGPIPKEDAQKEHILWKEENKKLEEWKTKISPMPDGEFDVVYADPPWRYDFKEKPRGKQQ